MTRNEAEQVVSELLGWDNVEIIDAGWGDFAVLATDPITGRRMEYSPATGFFEAA